jgi:hypothetical protein
MICNKNIKSVIPHKMSLQKGNGAWLDIRKNFSSPEFKWLGRVSSRFVIYHETTFRKCDWSIAQNFKLTISRLYQLQLVGVGLRKPLYEVNLLQGHLDSVLVLGPAGCVRNPELKEKREKESS